MTEDSKESVPAGISRRALDIGVALAFILVGVVVLYDSLRVGVSWGADGPQSGYFPFYVAVIMMASSTIVLVQAILSREPRKVVVEVAAMRSIAALLVPTIVYVGAIATIGIYVSSVFYLAYFMRLLGKYRWGPVIAVSLAIPIGLFFLFEVWFLVPLPKGPVEDWLGY
jgi:putative tricarboxylic transport membrane protein